MLPAWWLLLMLKLVRRLRLLSVHSDSCSGHGPWMTRTPGRGWGWLGRAAAGKGGFKAACLLIAGTAPTHARTSTGCRAHTSSCRLSCLSCVSSASAGSSCSLPSAVACCWMDSASSWGRAASRRAWAGGRPAGQVSVSRCRLVMACSSAKAAAWRAGRVMQPTSLETLNRLRLVAPVGCAHGPPVATTPARWGLARVRQCFRQPPWRLAPAPGLAGNA